jgi:cathepsin L
MFESVIKLRDGIVVDLSEQWLLDCNPYGWDLNNGWFASDIFFREGAVLSSDFLPGTSCIGVPIYYQAQTWHFCKNGYSVAPTNTIKSAIMAYGSVACMVYVDFYFEAYTTGVFNHAGTGGVNHFVTLCGWDDTKGAWRLKNTWGTGWGESGYMWIAYGCHDVGWAANYLVY